MVLSRRELQRSDKGRSLQGFSGMFNQSPSLSRKNLLAADEAADEAGEGVIVCKKAVPFAGLKNEGATCYLNRSAPAPQNYTELALTTSCVMGQARQHSSDST